MAVELASKLNYGLNKLRTFLKGDTVEMAAGTGGTPPTSSDTQLEAELLRKTSNPEDGVTGQAIHVMRLTVAEANGEILREVGLVDSLGNVTARIVHADVPKTEDFEIEYRIKERVRNP